MWSGSSGFHEKESSGAITQIKFAYFWQLVSDVLATIPANDGKVLFKTPSPNNTAIITTIPSSGDITIGVGGGGVYKISYSVSGVEPNAFAIFVNGVKSSGSVYGSGAGTQQNGGLSVITLIDGDVVSLRTDNCPAAITLALAGTTDTDQVIASIVFEKMS